MGKRLYLVEWRRGGEHIREARRKVVPGGNSTCAKYVHGGTITMVAMRVWRGVRRSRASTPGSQAPNHEILWDDEISIHSSPSEAGATIGSPSMGTTHGDDSGGDWVDVDACSNDVDDLASHWGADDVAIDWGDDDVIGIWGNWGDDDWIAEHGWDAA